LRRLRDELGMAIILITHDLGVARALADKVGVMYAGQIVEMGPADEVLNTPKMPYTQALFASLPQLWGERQDRLPAIPSRPPNLVSPPTGCRFAARCRHAADICGAPPALIEINSDHSSRCWYPHQADLRRVVEQVNISPSRDAVKP